MGVNCNEHRADNYAILRKEQGKANNVMYNICHFGYEDFGRISES